jgi:ribosomal-protein-alanine N-acetyltransferase
MPPDAPLLRLTTERLHVAQLPPDAAGRVLRYFEENRAHLEPVSPPRPATFHTPVYWRTRLAQDAEDARHGRSLRLYLLPREAPAGAAPVLGTVALADIRRGPLQACVLGYSLDHRHEGRGLMTEALRAVLAHALGPLGLHRVEANHLPENLRSAAVLRRLGFAVEGYARDYLAVGGRWRDHVLNALVADTPPPPP